jgi:antitoxin component YwqK of YwqJK toxin-antitoxin module
VDGPAIEDFADGYKAWYLNGKLHREGGHAVEKADGTKIWYLHGKLHREDGPALQQSNGRIVYYLNGINIPSLSEYNAQTTLVKRAI